MAALRIVALVGLALGHARAQAACPVRIDGDPDVAAQITAELAQFPDDSSPCVALHVTCTASAGGLTIDLSDELGGAAIRTFESAGGAAAFMISWSRRPMSASGLGVTAAPSAVLAATPAAPVGLPWTRWTSQPWHGELAASAVLSSGDSGIWQLMTASLLRQIAWFRFGAALRMITSVSQGWTSHVEVTVGATQHLSPELGVRLELVGSRSLFQLRDDSYQGIFWNVMAVRAGARATLAWSIWPALAIELSGGYEGVRAVKGDYGTDEERLFGSGILRGFGHVNLGLRWTI